MKKYLPFWTLLMSGMLFFVSCDNENGFENDPENANIPKTVLAAFEKEYGSEPAIWEIDGEYALANLTRTGETVWFDLNTAFCGMKETDISFEQLPEAVRLAFQMSSYKDWFIEDVDKLARTGSETLYVIEAENGGTEVDLYYTEDGILVKEFLDVEDDGYHECFPQKPTDSIESWIIENYGSDVRIVDYDNDNGRIEVEIIADGLKRELLFSSNNEWLQTKTEFRGTYGVPENIIIVAGAEHPDAIVEEVEMIETNDGRVYYCVELEDRRLDRDYKVFVDAITGEVINNPSLPEDDIAGGGVSVGSSYETFINERYPGARILERDDDDGLVEIEIIHDNLKKEVTFSRGEWLRTEWEAPLPEDIRILILNAGYQPDEHEWADIIETAEGIAYEVEAYKNRVEYDVFVDESGNVTARQDR